MSRPGEGLLILDDVTVRRLLPPPVAAAAVADMLARFSIGEGVQPHRLHVPSGRNDGQLLVMPAGDATGALAVKVVGLFPGNAVAGLPSITGLVLLFDPDTGRPCAVIDGAALTEIRTAAVSAVATAHLARADARRLTVVGTGAQARAHLVALAGVRPWVEARIAGRTPHRAAALVEWARERITDGMSVVAVDDIDDAVRGADVVCTTTSATEPVFDAGSVARHGVHVNAVGAHRSTARELPGALVGRAAVFVESRAAARAEAGDLCRAESEGLLSPDTPWTELGDVVAGRHPGRMTAEQTTVFKSVGMALEDLATAVEVYRRAVAAGLGTTVHTVAGQS